MVDRVSHMYPVEVKYAIHFPYCIVEDKDMLKYVGSCGVGVNYLSVALDGTVQMCSYTDGIIGNLFDKPLLELWSNGPEMVHYRSESWMPEQCVSCGYKATCASGCKMSSGGSIFAPDVLLQRVRESESSVMA